MARLENDRVQKEDFVFIAFARRLREAKKIERTLTEADIDYYIELCEYEDFFSRIFGGNRVGVSFFVKEDMLEYGIKILSTNRLTGCLPK